MACCMQEGCLVYCVMKREMAFAEYVTAPPGHMVFMRPAWLLEDVDKSANLVSSLMSLLRRYLPISATVHQRLSAPCAAVCGTRSC